MNISSSVFSFESDLSSPPSLSVYANSPRISPLCSNNLTEINRRPSQIHLTLTLRITQEGINHSPYYADLDPFGFSNELIISSKGACESFLAWFPEIRK